MSDNQQTGTAPGLPRGDYYLHEVDQQTWYEVVTELFEDDQDRAVFYICSRPDIDDKGHNHTEDEGSEWIAPLLVIE